jgi:hypothetical protein
MDVPRVYEKSLRTKGKEGAANERAKPNNYFANQF